MRLALYISAQAISAQHLQRADEHKAAPCAHENFAVAGGKLFEGIEIMCEQGFAKGIGQLRLRLKEQRSHIIRQRAAATALVIYDPRLAFMQHEVARLEISVQKESSRSAFEQIAQRLEIALEQCFIKRNARRTEETILEIVQVPEHALPVEGFDRRAHTPVH